MNVIGLLSWYDEPPLMLTGAIASWARTGITHLIALDGAYALLPDGKPSSPTDQHHAIRETCRACGIGLTLHIPTDRWYGNETEKRSTLFRLAEAIARPDDWYAVIDADEHVTQPTNLPAQLAEVDEDVAEVLLLERIDVRTAETTDTIHARDVTRRLYRAIPGLQVHGAHNNYVTPDGRRLWGDTDLEPAADLTTLHLEHRQRERPYQRTATQREYYRLRDHTGIETIPQGGAVS